ncbi:MAG: RNA-protein complex protein Nop10 [Halobacteriales archaeon]
MKALIKRCAAGHDTKYTLGETCPDCGSETENTAPPPYSPDDPYGEHRRRTKEDVT